MVTLLILSVWPLASGDLWDSWCSRDSLTVLKAKFKGVKSRPSLSPYGHPFVCVCSCCPLIRTGQTRLELAYGTPLALLASVKTLPSNVVLF